MAKKSQDKNHSFLLSWDCNGLEACVPIHELEEKHKQAEKERAWTTLASVDGEDPGNPVDREIGRIYQSIMMRARINSQRHYEIYTVQTDPSISKDDMVRMFEENPQHMAELIRERGTQLYSDRASQKTVIL
jgi:hypothetical protein